MSSLPNLPHSIESERAVMGSILLDNAAYQQASAVLRAGDFFLKSNQTIFLRAGLMLASGRAVDGVTLFEDLARHNELDLVGGASYIASLTDGLPRLSNIEHYVRIVKDKSLLRATIYHATDIIAKAQNGIEHTGRFLEWARTEMPAAPDAEHNIVGSILEDLEEKRVDWLWENRIPLGAISLLDGNPGDTKSLVMVEIGARVSRGYPLPGGKNFSQGAGVVVCSAEDDTERVIRPRFRAANADLSRVLIVPYMPEHEGQLTVSRVPDDIPVLRQAIRRVAARLVIIDVLMAYLPAELNSNRDQDVRLALAPLGKLAEETQCAIVLIRHLNKNIGLSALHRGGGSIGIVGAARSGLLLARDPSADDLRVLAVFKSNFGAFPESLSYRVQANAEGLPTIKWEGSSTHTPESLLTLPDRNEDRGAKDEAIGFLRAELSEGPREAAELLSAAKQLGIAERTLKRAKEDAGIKSAKRGDKWFWSLQNGGKNAKIA